MSRQRRRRLSYRPGGAGGHGAPQDYVRAYMWFNLAATSGNQEAAHNRDLLAGHMTSEQIAEAQRLEHERKPQPER
jgi:TPR repeat protein